MKIFLTICFFGLASAEHIVNTNSGPIQGVSSLAEDVEAYLSIPYAEPPVGELRFSKPVPKTQWTEVHRSSSLPPPCTQMGLEPRYYFLPNISNVSEDCLYLNIWAPKSESSQGLRPVVIFIHPGVFLVGSSNVPAHDGSRLAKRGDLVVATINYRLGALGFFLANIEEAGGNMGMFDQIMAIKWIKDNAIYFGGDPDNIVLMGASAGAFAISAHMVSPLSKGLFKRAIIESGSILVPVFMDNNAALFKNSKSLAALVGCTNETVTLESHPLSVVECLKRQPKEAFMAAEEKMFETKPMIFYPRVNDEFLPMASIEEFFREGKFRRDVDVMAGIIEEEGPFLLMFMVPGYFGNYGRNYENNLNKARFVTLTRALLATVGQTANVSEITDFYKRLVNDGTPVEYVKTLANIIGDYGIACGTLFLADFFSAKGNSVYFYKFEFQSPSSPMAEWIGSSHLDELQYVFGNPYHDDFTTEEIQLSQSLMDRWSAFARTGNPNIPGELPWPQYSHEMPLYLNIEQEDESIRLGPNDRCEIWRKRFKSELDPELIQRLQNSERSAIKTAVRNIERPSVFRMLRNGFPYY